MKVAILMPVLNCENTINQTLNSLLNQSHSDFCLYIINNGCTDSTIEKIKVFNDSRIQLYNFLDVQMCSAALNYGLDLIKEKYVCRADGDDIYHKDYIKTYLDTIQKYNAKVVYGSYISIRDGQTISNTVCLRDRDLLIWRLLFLNTVSHNVIYDKEFIISLGKYKLLPHSEDYELWQRCILTDSQSIIGTTPEFYSSTCLKNNTCMTVRYGHINNTIIHLSKVFIKNFLNVDLNEDIIKKIRTPTALNNKEIIIMNKLLTIYIKKMNISNSKFLQNKTFFQFYV